MTLYKTLSQKSLPQKYLPHQPLQPYNSTVDTLSAHDSWPLSFYKLSFWTLEDAQWMHYALALAKQGAEYGEVPVGAVLVHNHTIIGRGFNQPIGRHDATAHAEIIAIREACMQLKNYRLPPQTTLYVTLEPCTMCIGALIHARVDRLIYAASEPRAGMVGSQMNLAMQPFYNHHITVYKGLDGKNSSQILKSFFRKRRQAAKSTKIEMNTKR